MQVLVGSWHGWGRAMYPTIAITHYREELTIRPHKNKPVWKIEQKTWRSHPTQPVTEHLLHWEVGFLRRLDDGSYEWLNTQNNGRVEVLKGTLEKKDDGIELTFDTVVFGNDSCMLSSTRRITMVGDTLSYVMEMATCDNPTSQMHLEAALYRQAAEITSP